MLLTILAVVVAATFAFTGGIKLFNVPASLKVRDSLDVPPGLWRTIGVLEWLGAAGVVIGLAYAALGLLASIGLVALLAGAMVTRLRAAGRHDRSEAAGLAGDAATLVLVIVTATVFAMNL
jgi:DoxX-like protein